ncbi:MAG: Nicotinate-nucleotide--dimethylbenzimidazole phosphoribosyltransferase, partial [uncultured Thermomicrobiales bacterium]
GAAMARGEAEAAVAAGAAVVEARLDDGIDLLALGEIGIGNTTAAAAVTAALLGVTAEATVGPGTGIDDAALAGKRRVVAAALQRHRPDPTDPIAVLAAVGGLELAALAGAMLRAAAARVPVLLDGFPTGAAALVAAALDPAVVPYLIASHRSPEPGHRLVLEWLGKEPLLELGMRLGEASGALLGLQVVDAALAVHAEMATFAEAGVAGPVQTPPNGPSASSDAADGGLEAGAGAATPPSAVPNLRRDSLLATLTSSVSSSRDQSDPERHRPSPGHVDRGA